MPTETELEIIAASLSESAMRYHLLVENIPAVMIRYDLKRQKYVYLNTKTFWTGHTLAEWNELSEEIRSSWLHPNDLEDHIARVQDWELSDRDSLTDVEYRLRHKKGHYIWVKSLLYKERSEVGEPVAIVEISIDITDRKELEGQLETIRVDFDAGMERATGELIKANQALNNELEKYRQQENELIMQEESYRVLFDDSIDGIIIAIPNHTIVHVNKRAAELTGYDREELRSSTIKNLFTAEEFDKLTARVEKRSDEGTPLRQFVTDLQTKAGKTVNLEMTAARTTWMGKPANAFTMRDIAERRLSQGQKISRMVRQAVAERHTFYEEIVSKNTAILRMFEILPTIAESDSSLLITGESGTGKELIARAIHNLSPRCKKPLITVNCSALPDTLIESELFGYKKGAFTDAKEDRQGRFAQAEGGTLFLDEIGDISPAMQVKLLRAIQEKIIEPLGSSESVRTNIRILTATNRDIDKMVEEGTFRQDLFYRINVIRLFLPPLRDRMEDIPFLVEHFIGKFRRMFGKDITSISPQALTKLMNHHYPGNIRELENFIEHAFLLCRGDKIMPEHLPDLTSKTPTLAAQKDASARVPATETSSQPATSGTIHEKETILIVECLKRNHWNRTAAAEELGIHRVTLNRKIHKLGVELPEIDGRSAYREKS
jgi:PAS domain S-box-containing protein